MNLLQRLRQLRRQLADIDRVPDIGEHLVTLGFFDDDDPQLILAALDTEIAALEADGDDDDDAEADGGEDV